MLIASVRRLLTYIKPVLNKNKMGDAEKGLLVYVATVNCCYATKAQLIVSTALFKETQELSRELPLTWTSVMV